MTKLATRTNQHALKEGINMAQELKELTQEHLSAASNELLASSLHAVGHVLRDVMGKKNSGGVVLEAAYRLSETRKISPRAIATILHALDLFIADDCEIAPGCTHFSGFTVPTREEVEQLIEVIEQRGLASLPVKEADEKETAEVLKEATKVAAEETPAPAAVKGLADLLNGLGGDPAPEEAHPTLDELKKYAIKTMFRIKTGKELNSESMEEEMISFRKEMQQSLTSKSGDGTPGGDFLAAAQAVGVSTPGTPEEIEKVIAETREALLEVINR
jgi:hypothetical protein